MPSEDGAWYSENMAGKEEEQRRGGGTTWAATIILQALVVGLPTGRTWLLPDVKNV